MNGRLPYDNDWRGTSPWYTEAAPQNGFGIASLCVAATGVVVGSVPILGIPALLAGVLAMTFGIIGSARAQRGTASNGRMSTIGTILGFVAVAVGIWGVHTVSEATAEFERSTQQSLRQLNSGYPSSGLGSSSDYYSGLYPGLTTTTTKPPSASFTYEVTGNYPASFFSYTDSNGDSVSTYENEGIGASPKRLPWSKTVRPEPNGNANSLGASTSSTKGDAWISCTVKDDRGAVISTDTDKGAYAQCYASSRGSF